MKQMKFDENPEAISFVSHLLSDQVKWMIVHYKIQGKSNKETARIVAAQYNRPSLSHQTVKAVWAKFHDTQEVANLWARIGQPSVLSEEQIKELEKYFRKKPKNSVEEAKVDLNISVSRQAINKVLLAREFELIGLQRNFL